MCARTYTPSHYDQQSAARSSPQARPTRAHMASQPYTTGAIQYNTRKLANPWIRYHNEYRDEGWHAHKHTTTHAMTHNTYITYNTHARLTNNTSRYRRARRASVVCTDSQNMFTFGRYTNAPWCHDTNGGRRTWRCRWSMLLPGGT